MEDSGSEVTEEEVRDALSRLSRSQALAGSGKLIRFLRFVVECTLRGEGVQLKETVIGMSVFGRPPDYDPKIDTIVRSQAWRLRTKLAEYYGTEGTSDALKILLRKGSYVPQFVRSARDAASVRQTG